MLNSYHWELSPKVADSSVPTCQYMALYGNRVHLVCSQVWFSNYWTDFHYICYWTLRLKLSEEFDLLDCAPKEHAPCTWCVQVSHRDRGNYHFFFQSRPWALSGIFGPHYFNNLSDGLFNPLKPSHVLKILGIQSVPQTLPLQRSAG